MNIEQILSIVRWLLSVGGPIGAYLISRGIPAEQVTILQTAIIAIIGALPPIVAFVWGLFSRTDKATIKSAAAIAGTTVVTTEELANATPNQPNIVSNIQNKVVTK